MSEPTPPSRLKSLKEFNYFDENRRPDLDSSALDKLPTTPETEERLREHRRQGLKIALQLGLSMAAIVALTWFLAGYRYWIAYAFSWQTEPLKLGDVTTMRPEEIPHNAYVEVQGITEHRGLSEKEVRGLSLGREEYWYFRLLGSRGVFISVPGDPDKYGIVTEVTVAGRAVDPAREHCCDQVLAAYRERYFPREEGELRFIQVDSKPGEGRWPFVFLFLLYAAVLASAGFALRRAFKHAMEKRFVALPVGLPRR